MMKKIGLLIALLAVIAVASETDVFYWDFDNEVWVFAGTPGPTSLARCWNQLPTGGACNKQYWSFDFYTSASMAQWVEWSISATEWKWRIRKVGPVLCQTDGYYATDCITFTIKSNYDISVAFDGFEDLYNANSVDQYIEVYYALGEWQLPPPLGSNFWYAAPDLNDVTYYFYDSDTLHNGISLKFWNYIHVTNCNSACEYVDVDGGEVTIELELIKTWIDPETGYFL